MKTRSQLSSELADELALAEDFEQRLDMLRRFRNAEFLRIALNDLHGQMKPGLPPGSYPGWRRPVWNIPVSWPGRNWPGVIGAPFSR